jgi:hypothetical protein
MRVGVRLAVLVVHSVVQRPLVHVALQTNVTTVTSSIGYVSIRPGTLLSKFCAANSQCSWLHHGAYSKGLRVYHCLIC